MTFPPTGVGNRADPTRARCDVAASCCALPRLWDLAEARFGPKSQMDCNFKPISSIRLFQLRRIKCLSLRDARLLTRFTQSLITMEKHFNLYLAKPQNPVWKSPTTSIEFKRPLDHSPQSHPLFNFPRAQISLWENISPHISTTTQWNLFKKKATES